MRHIPIAAALALAAAAGPALAHHSFAMFDPAKRMTIEGTLTTLQWTAPHVILWVQADKIGPYDAGLWSIEMPTSPGNLGKMGWSRTTIRPGDKLQIDIDPIRDGRRSGSFKKGVLVVTGKLLTVGAIPGAAPAATK
jgi:hypothetical protein